MVTAKTAAASKATNKQDVAGRRVAKKGEPKLALYVEKAIPPRIQEFVDWLEKETGYAVDARSVYLGSSLRSTFQQSDENQTRIKQRSEEIAQERADRAKAREDRAAAKIQREQERAEKAAAAKAAPAKPAAAKKAPAAKSTPAAKAPAKRSTAAAKTPAAKATPSRRRPARPAAEDADF